MLHKWAYENLYAKIFFYYVLSAASAKATVAEETALTSQHLKDSSVIYPYLSDGVMAANFAISSSYKIKPGPLISVTK